MTEEIPSKPDLSVDMATILASSVHDMKNSVSMLINGLHKTLAETDPASFPSYGDLVQMSYEAKRINSNLIQLLTLYKLGQEIYPFDPQQVCIADFLRGVGNQYTGFLNSQKVHLELLADPGLYWYFDEDLVAGVIGNALNNAMHYTHDCVHLIAQEHDGELVLRIEDNGRGYPASMLQESIDSMRGVDFRGGSTGLGLYFSAAVARLHHCRGRVGKIELENGGSLGGGCFVLHLP